MLWRFLFRLLKWPLFVVSIASGVFIFFLYQFLLSSNLEDGRNEISVELARLKTDLPPLLYQKTNVKFAKRLAEGLKTRPVSQYTLHLNDELIDSWSRNPSEISRCGEPINTFVTYEGIFLGKISTCLSSSAITERTLASPLFLAVTVFAVLLMLIVGFLPLRSYKISIYDLFYSIKEWKKDPSKKIRLNSKDPIARAIVDDFRKSHENQLELEQTKMDYETDKEVFRITKQVSHDIESPASSLQIAWNAVRLNFDDSEKSDELEAIDLSLKRILNICSELKQKNRKHLYTAHKPVISNIPSLVRDVVKEKEINYPETRFIINYDGDAPGFCSPSAFKRVLSNVINNGVEAINHPKGLIVVDILEAEKVCKVVVSDNGRGISPEAASHVFEYEFTHGKENGNGLGLSYAKSKLESWGGAINILRTDEKGTKIELVVQKFIAEEKNDADISI